MQEMHIAAEAGPFFFSLWVADLQDSNIQFFVYSIFVLLIHLSARESQVRSVLSAGHGVVLFAFIPPSIHESTLLFFFTFLFSAAGFADFRSDTTQ